MFALGKKLILERFQLQLAEWMVGWGGGGGGGDIIFFFNKRILFSGIIDDLKS